MKKMIFVIMLILAGALSAQSKTSNVRAEEQQQLRQDLTIAKQVIGEKEIELVKVKITVQEQQAFLKQARKVLLELANAETIEEKNAIVEKYQLKPKDE